MKKTYSLVLNATTLQYSIILVAQQGLHLHLMDDVTTYLYGSFENENHIYMKIPKDFICSTRPILKRVIQ